MGRVYERRIATGAALLACAVALGCRATAATPEPTSPEPTSPESTAPESTETDDWTRRGWRVVEPADTSGRFAEPPPDRSDHPDQSEPSGPDLAGELDDDEPCVQNEQAQRECEGKDGWAYGPHPYGRCKGTAPFPGELEAVRESIRRSSCECYELAAVEERRRRCARVP